MLRVELGPVTEVQGATKVNRHRLQKQRKGPGSLSEGSVPLI